MAGRRPQPVTQATNPAPQQPVEMPSLMSSAVMPAPPQPQMMPMQQPQTPQQIPINAMGGSPMSRPMPQQYGGYRPQPYNPFGGFGGGFGGGCGHGGGGAF